MEALNDGYTSWLIELRNSGLTYYQCKPDDDWTTDHNQALHFSRKQDAQQVIDYYGWTEAVASEHLWQDGRSAAPEQRGEDEIDEDKINNDAVDRFASAMKLKLKKKRLEGKFGWSDKEFCTRDFLNYCLSDHMRKGDPIDVGNFAMMLFCRGERTEYSKSLDQVRKEIADTPQPTRTEAAAVVGGDVKLPFDLRVGRGTFKKGVSLSTAQGAIDRLYERAAGKGDAGKADDVGENK